MMTAPRQRLCPPVAAAEMSRETTLRQEVVGGDCWFGRGCPASRRRNGEKPRAGGPDLRELDGPGEETSGRGADGDGGGHHVGQPGQAGCPGRGRRPDTASRIAQMRWRANMSSRSVRHRPGKHPGGRRAKARPAGRLPAVRGAFSPSRSSRVSAARPRMAAAALLEKSGNGIVVVGQQEGQRQHRGNGQGQA